MMAKRMGKLVEFSNGLTQLQWCAATLKYLEREVCGAQAPIDAESACVVHLLDGLLSPCQQSVAAICSVLIDAIGRGVIACDPIIQSLVTSCASMPHWTVGISTLGQIMMKKVASVKTGGFYTCPFSLRSSPHPFISVFNSRPESGLCIADITIEMLRKSLLSNCLESVLNLLTPLLKFFFLHPSPSSEHTMVSSHLHTSLLSLVETHHKQGGNVSPSFLLLYTLTSLLSLTPSHSQQCLLTLSKQIERLATLWSKFRNSDMMTQMVDTCLATCCKLVERGLCSDPLLRCVLHLVTGPYKVQLLGRHLFCLSWLALQLLLVPSTLNLILHIVWENFKLLPQPYIVLLILPVVQILSLPQHNDQSTLGKLANCVIQAIQKSKKLNWKTEDTKCSRLPLNYQPYPLFQLLIKTLCNILSSPVKTIAWLNQISTEFLKLPKSSLDALTLMLSALLASGLHAAYYEEKEEENLRSVIRVFTLIADTNPSISPSLLPLILYFIPFVQHHSGKLVLLYSLPSLATHHFAVGPTINVLQILARDITLLPVALRLLGKLWIKHDSVFPHIVSLLKYNKIPARIATEFAIAKAVVLKDICCTRGEQHGEEMLAHISTIIDQSKHSLAAALAIDAVSALCQTNVVDPVTVWSILHDKIYDSQRIAVAVAACSFLSLASNVDVEQRSAGTTFKAAALKHLWKMVYSKNHQVCSAALDALRHFGIADFLIDHLPQEAPQPQCSLPAADTYAVDTEEQVEVPLPTGYFICLLSIIPPESFSSLSRFLAALLSSELEAIPRGTVSSALKRSQACTSLEKGVHGLEDTLKGMCLAYQEKDNAYGLVAGTSVMLHGMTSLTISSGNQVRGAQWKMNECSALLEEALRRGRISLEVHDGESVDSALTCLCLPRQWAKFMKGICDSFTKAWLVRSYPSSIWEDPKVLEEKTHEARDWAKKELIEKLTELLKYWKNPISSSVSLLAAVGLICGTKLSTGQGIVPKEPMGAWSPLQLLHIALTEFQRVIVADDAETSMEHPLSLLLSTLRGHADLSVYLLVCPVLVETALQCRVTPPQSLYTCLEALLWCVWRHFNKKPMWYTGVILNELMTMLLPRLHQAETLLYEVVQFTEGSLQCNSLKHLCMVSSIVPTLSIAKQANACIGVLGAIQKRLQSTSPAELKTRYAQIAALHYASTCRLLYPAGIIGDSESMQSVTLLADLATKAPHIPSYHLGFGAILHGLLAGCHPTIFQLADTVAARWIEQLLEHTSTDEVHSIVWGLAGLIGVNPIYEMYCYNESISPLPFVETLFPLVRNALGKICDEGNSSITLWLLGRVFQITSIMLNKREKVPMDYSCLPDGTLLPTLFLNTCSNDIIHETSQMKCLLNVFASVKIQFPVCDFSKMLVPCVRQNELQSSCVQMVVHQGSTGGLSLLAAYILNMMLRGCLQTDAQLMLLENLCCFMNLVPVWKYLPPLCTSILNFYPNLQWPLHSLLKGLKNMLSAESDVFSATHCECNTTNLVYEMWEFVCDKGRLMELCNGQGKSMLTVFADCLSLADYTLVTCDTSVPKRRIAFDCILQCCWVESGKDGVSSLYPVIKWTLENEGIEPAKAVMEYLVRVMWHICRSTDSLLIATELLHTLLMWSRGNKASGSQLQLVMLMIMAVISPYNPGCTVLDELELEPWLTFFSLPTSELLQEKTLHCLLEWFSHHSEDVHKCCLMLLEFFTATRYYSNSIVWTTVAHNL